mmetsp:Transcript_8535/g.12634  ORF Transcript_8535/g.12634 Transcript_8535/m.12634 type:complete len:323 (-) Transcript_8535:1547-2515(-)
MEVKIAIPKAQKNAIVQEVAKIIQSNTSPEMFLEVHNYIQKTTATVNLHNIYYSSKKLPYLNVTYEKYQRLELNYWKGFYSSSIIVEVSKEGLKVSHLPSIPQNFTVSSDLKSFVNSVIAYHKKHRLLALAQSFPGIEEVHVSNELTVLVEGVTLWIDIDFFTGKITAEVEGIENSYLTKLMNSGNWFEEWHRIRKVFVKYSLDWACGSLGLNFVKNPLRFCKSLYINLESWNEPPDTLGYIEFDQMLSKGSVFTFAIRVRQSARTVYELVLYKDTQEKQCVVLEEDESTYETIKNCISKAKNLVTLMKIPLAHSGEVQLSN